MKKFNLLLVLVAVFGFSAFFTSCDMEDAVSYNDQVLNYYTLLDNQIADFENALWDEDYTVDDLQLEFDKTMKIYQDNYTALKEVKVLKKDPGFHASVVEFYDGVKKALDEEYTQIMDMYKADDWEDSFGEAIYDLDDKVLDKLIDMESKVTTSQEEFAAAYGITLAD